LAFALAGVSLSFRDTRTEDNHANVIDRHFKSQQSDPAISTVGIVIDGRERFIQSSDGAPPTVLAVAASTIEVRRNFTGVTRAVAIITLQILLIGVCFAEALHYHIDAQTYVILGGVVAFAYISGGFLGLLFNKTTIEVETVGHED
jgi:hypothetical protein